MRLMYTFNMELRRKLYSRLVEWKEQETRKPLLLFGARQVGKTYLLSKQFGPAEFSSFYIFNFKEDGSTLHKIFSKDFNPKRILNELSLFLNKTIDISKDLIIFDEVQDCPFAIECLKYFAESYPGSYIIATGSMLRVKLFSPDLYKEVSLQAPEDHYSFSYPVGKVTELCLYPLSFEEFLMAHGGELLLKAFNDANRSMIAHEKFLEFYKDFLYVGGMPEVVKSWDSDSENIVEMAEQIRMIQMDILSSYKRDFIAKENMVNGTHLATVYDSIFTQIQHSLVNDSSAKRFRFKDVIPGKKRFEDLRNVLDWLENSGIVYKIFVIDSDPLNSPDAFIRQNIFKLVPHDIGLLNARLQHSYKEIKMDELGFVKGVLAEVFVANEIRSSVIKDHRNPLLCWVYKSGSYEVEFILKNDRWGVYPVEVKGGSHTSSPSLKKYTELFNPKKTITLSTRPGGRSESDHLSFPIYFAGVHQKLLD
jgi:uncharacterized protein